MKLLTMKSLKILPSEKQVGYVKGLKNGYSR